MSPSLFSKYSRSRKILRSSLFLAMLTAVRLWAEDESPIPHAWPSARYEKMGQHSPFALATPAAPIVESQISFAANWFVSGIGRFREQDFVTIKARDLSTQFSLYGHDANLENGVSLTSIDWSAKIGKSTVVIKKGTETAKLEFNEAEIRGPAQVTTATGARVGGNKNGDQRAMGGSGQPLKPLSPYSAGHPPIPRPSNPAAMTSANRFPPAGGNPSQGQDRHRIRIINAPQSQ